MKKIFIYARRSNTKGQWVSISIEKQIEEMERECKYEWYQIVAIYKDNKSWYKSGKRDDFTAMIEAIEEHNIKGRWERIDAVMVYMASRLCRNRQEAHKIEWMVEDETIQFFSLLERYTDDLSSRERFIHDINKAIYESKYKSTDAKKNMDRAAQKGRLTRKPPYGYKVVWRDFDSKVIIDNNYQAAEVVKKSFELYATGKYWYETLAQELNWLWYKRPLVVVSDGKKVIMTRNFTQKDMEWIFINKFYWGKVEQTYNNLISEEREYFSRLYGDKMKPGAKSITIDYTDRLQECWTFIPLITRELFEKCENIRKKNSNWESKDRVFIDDEYVWKGILRCPCKKDEWWDYTNLRSFTVEKKTKKKTWKVYLYYRCSCNSRKSCQNKYMSENEVDELLMKEIISKLNLTDEEVSIFQELIAIDLDKLKSEEVDVHWELEHQLSKIIKDLLYFKERVVEERDEDLREIAREKYEKAKKDKEETENQLKVLPDVIEDDRKKIKEYVWYIEEIKENLLSYSITKKRALLKTIFEYVIISDKNITEFKLKPFFEFVYNRKVPTGSWKNWKWVGTNKKEITEPKTDLWSPEFRNGGPTWDWTRDQSVMSRLL